MVLQFPLPFVGIAGNSAQVNDVLTIHGSLVLCGPAGVGKTRLASEAAVQLNGRQVEIVTASPTLHETPFAAFATLLGRLDRTATGSHGTPPQGEFLALALEEVSTRLRTRS